jgi:hypothetical protein
VGGEPSAPGLPGTIAKSWRVGGNSHCQAATITAARPSGTKGTHKAFTFRKGREQSRPFCFGKCIIDTDS